MGVDFFIADIVGNGQFDFTINVGAPWQIDPNDYSITLTGNIANSNVSPAADNTPTFVDTSSANIFLESGDSFVLGWHGSGIRDGVGLWGSFVNDGIGLYGGELWGDNPFNEPGLHAGGGWDIGFRTYVSPIPVPAAIWLFGTALVGLVGFTRRKLTA